MVNREGVKNEGNYLQFENALNNIKGLSYSSGFSGSSHSDDLRTLLDTYKKVGDIDQRIKAVEKQAEREDERQKYSVLSQASQSMIEQRKAYEGHKLDLQAQKDKEMALLIKKNEIVYKKLDSFHKEQLAKQKEDNKNLSEVVNSMKSGKPIKDAHKKKLIKTPEQKRKAKERNAHIVKSKFVAEADIELHTKELVQVEERIRKLSPYQKEELLTLQKRRKLHKERCKRASDVSKKFDLHVVQLAERVQLVHEGIRTAKDKDQIEFFNLQFQEVQDISNPVLLGMVAQALEKKGIKVDLAITLSVPAEQGLKATTISSIIAAGPVDRGHKVPVATPRMAKPTSKLSR